MQLDWLPYILDIPAYLGSAKVDAEGRVLEQDRNAHQWRRVKYSYMDVRREANRVGLTIRGTQKIWNSSLAGIGLLYAKRHGVFRAYNDEVFERFWKHELDIENPAALADVLKRAGADARLRCLRGGRGPARADGGPGSGRGRGRVRRAELPLARRRPVLGPRASAAHPRNPGDDQATLGHASGIAAVMVTSNRSSARASRGTGTSVLAGRRSGGKYSAVSRASGSRSASL